MLFGVLPFSEQPFSTLGSETVVVDPSCEFDFEVRSVGLVYVPMVQGGEFGWETGEINTSPDEWIDNPEFGYEIDGPFIFHVFSRNQSSRVVIAGRRSTPRRITVRHAYRRVEALSSDE